MKKILKCLSVLLCVAVLIGLLVGCGVRLEVGGDYSTIYEDGGYRELTVAEDGVFTVLQITDMHLVGGNNRDDQKTLTALDDILKAKDYDLVILTGDAFEGKTARYYNKSDAVAKVGKLFRDNEQRFTYVAGNNDGEKYGSDKDIVMSLAENEYFCFADNDLQGCGNFYIKLLDANGGELHRLVLFDTSHRDAKGEYIHIGSDQIAWYSDVAAECKALGIKHSFFGHIPFFNCKAVMDNGVSVTGDNDKNNVDEFYSDDQNGSNPLLAAIETGGSCGMVAFGHLHEVDAAKLYNNIVYKYTRAAGTYCKLGKDFKNGVAEITINTRAGEVADTYCFNTLTY